MSELANDGPRYHKVILDAKADELLSALNAAYDKAQNHAKHCRSCFHRIIDEEGNPGYMGEACKNGAEILKSYKHAESAYWTANQKAHGEIAS